MREDALCVTEKAQADGAPVVGDAADGLEGVRKVRELLPDLVTMDAPMPNMDGAEATRQIKEERPHVGVLFV